MMKNLIIILSLISGFAIADETYYVDGTNGSDGAGNGSSAAPFKSLSKATSTATSGDTIIVKAGTYKGSSNRNITISGKRLVIKSQDGAASTIFDAEGESRHLSIYYADTTFKLVGFTFKNGSYDGNGGSIYSRSTNYAWGPVIESCVFDSNKTSGDYGKGGAIFTSGQIMLRDVEFNHNHTKYYGGALYVDSYHDAGDTSKTVIERTKFYGNYVNSSGSSNYGGAAYINANYKMNHCTFDSNMIKMDEGYNYGGALYSYGTNIGLSVNTFTDTSNTIQNTVFKQNKIIKGSDGGNAYGGAVGIAGNRITIFENCLFINNEANGTTYADSYGETRNANGHGGAVNVQMNSRYNSNTKTYEANPIIFVNNTFANNSNAGYWVRGGGIHAYWYQSTILFNNIFWGNKSLRENTVENYGWNEMWNDYTMSGNNNLYFSNNSFEYFDPTDENNKNSTGSGSSISITQSNNKIGLNPGFISSGSYPYALADNSQLIGAGISSYQGYSAPNKDINNNSRPNPANTNIDLGAYENALGASPYPKQVDSVTVAVTDNQATLTWKLNSADNIVSYKVYKSLKSGFSISADSLAATVNQPSSGTTASATITGLTNKTTYYFALTAVNNEGLEGSPSKEVSVYPYYNGPTWYVATAAKGGSDSNEGSSNSPLLTLKVAIDSAKTGHTISIGSGTHQYDASSDWNFEFRGNKSLIIQGQGPDSTILDAQSKNRHFTFNMNDGLIDTSFKVLDLTLKNGKPSLYSGGGSVYIYDYWNGSSYVKSGPLFQNVNFEKNSSNTDTTYQYNQTYGGAVYTEPYSAAYFRNCTFKYNTAIGKGGAVFTDGSYSMAGYAPTYEKCTFTGNISDASSGTFNPGGGAIRLTGPAILISCVFDSNQVIANKNYNANGGAIDIWMEYSNSASDRVETRIENCTFTNNSITPGPNGGGYAYGGALKVGGYAEVIVTNSLFANNKAEAGTSVSEYGTQYSWAYGGAINSEIYSSWDNNTSSYSFQGKLVIINSTFTKNKAQGAFGDSYSQNNGRGGAINLEWAQQANLFNNVIWGNSANGTSEGDSSISYNSGTDSDIRGSNNSIQFIDGNIWGNNNVMLNPEFEGSGSTPYALHGRSPLLGAGVDSLYGYNAPSIDILGNARPNPSGSKPDLGAYENNLSSSPYPDKVAGLKAQGGDGLVTLTWTKSSETDVSQYIVYRHTANFTPAAAYVIDTVATNTHTSTGLNNATRYYFRVTALNSSGYEGSATAIDITPTYTGPVWYVAIADSGGSDSNEGSEASPLLTFSKAWEKASSGDTILIGDGTYSGSNYRDLDIREGKALLIKSRNGPDKVIFDAGKFGRHLDISLNDPSKNIDSTFVIEGITFINGGSNEYGGSIRISGGNFWDPNTQQSTNKFISPKFVNCIFRNNSTTRYGGAVYISYANPIFESCVFDSNTVTTIATVDGGAHGGAVYVGRGSPQFRNSTFSANKADGKHPGTSNGGYYPSEGGAIYFESQDSTSTKIINCTFKNNAVNMVYGSPSGGAIYFGTLYNISSHHDGNQYIMDRSTFHGNIVSSTSNSSSRGSALYVRAPSTITNSLFYDNTSQSTNYNFGGAIGIDAYAQYDQATQTDVYPYIYLINNTIVNNSVEGIGQNAGKPNGSSGGIGFYSTSSVRGAWFNNIIWDNKAQGSMDINWSSDAKVSFGHNVVKDIYAGELPTDNLYSKYPNFLDTTNNVFSLSESSYLIGRGVSSFDGIKAPTNDIDGQTRPNPSGSDPDIGAFENILSTSPYPSQVTNLVATSGDKHVRLNWAANAETDVVSYTVYMSQNQDFVPASTDSIATVDTTYYVTADTLTNKKEYFFSVAAVNQKGNRGDHSEVIKAIPYYRGPKWYVAVDGENTGDGSELSPFADIQTAVDSAASGHTIILRAGVHKGQKNRNINLNDFAGKSLRLQGEQNAGDVFIDAENSGYHFGIQGDYDSTLVFANINFIRGSGYRPDDGNGNTTGVLGGSIVIFGYRYYDNNTQQDVDIHPTPKFISCNWEQNNSYAPSDQWGEGGAVYIALASPSFHNSTFKNNGSSSTGGAVKIWSDSQYTRLSSPKFYNCVFDQNYVSSNGSGSVNGGAVSIMGAGNSVFYQSQFIKNYVSSNNDGAYGGAVYIEGNWDKNKYNNIVFDQNLFSENYAASPNNNGWGGAIVSKSPFSLINSVLVKNFAVSDYPNGGALGIDIYESDGERGRSLLINNTIAFNELRNSSGSLSGQGAGISAYGEQEGYWFNNIIYFNKSSNDQSVSLNSEKVGFEHNNVDDKDGKSWFGDDNLSEDPKFKNPSGDDYRLRLASGMIDAGTEGQDQDLAPKVDHRGYYRLGKPDIGAYEFGASKYILDMVDDISPLPRDTTYLSRGQEFDVTMKTNDNEGNIVTAAEPIQWFISPTDKHVTIVSYDSVTSNGEAKVTVKATGITGFKFRVGAEIAEATRRTNVYIIEKLVTGAPKTVADIKIDPSGWTNNNSFNISWTNPDTVGYGRDYLGALIQLGDEDPTSIVRHPDSLNFHVNSAQVSTPEMGEWTYKVWLFDELGNEDVKNADSVKAKFDEQPPDEFSIHYPFQNVWESDKPQFRWQATGDYPSGIESWAIFINGNEYARLLGNEISYDNNSDEFYVDAPTALSDGWYNWHMEIRDMAGNVTNSRDTINFGVDITPPLIRHDNPLQITDEGSTTPSIDVNITDGASGVEIAELHYRRAGTGSGFVSTDLLSGPVSIPGSDIKSDGLEYYISAEDSVGNEGFWPADGEIHSVRIRTESNVTTASRWSVGIPGGIDPTNYVFFSIPFDVSNGLNGITSVLGDPDEFKYRLFGFNMAPDSTGWREHTLETSLSVTVGNGYFFIFDPDKYSDIPNITFDFGPGTSIATDPPYEINVASGQWKFFGHPYNFNVSLNNVYTEDGTNINDAGSVYTWNSNWTGVNSLQPWQGYIFKSGGATKLIIDSRGDSFGKMAKTVADLENMPMDADEWIVDIRATTGSMIDEMNSIGVSHIAEDGYDRLDEFEPPVVPGNLTLRVDNRSREKSPDIYAKDIRKPNKDGHYWDLQVLAPTNGERTYLTFDGLGYIPEEYDIFLINKTNKQAINLEWESTYRFANTGSDSYLKQDLRLVIGTKTFVEENNAGVNLYPDAFKLSQNYPNPFNPQTSIMISLEEDAQVDLIIYNLLGEEVTRLAASEYRPAGYYNFIWNGRNSMGTKVSTGVYFYHAMIQNAQGKVVLNKTKKMIFLK